MKYLRRGNILAPYSNDSTVFVSLLCVRINKKGSQKDQEQKRSGNYFFYDDGADDDDDVDDDDI
jgi:hypothetical protein